MAEVSALRRIRHITRRSTNGSRRACPSAIRLRIRWLPSRSAERNRYAQTGRNVQIKVVAKFNDGQIRDVTKEATVESNTPDVAKVDATSKVSGERTGEATLLVRYQGKFSTVPLTILNPKPGFAWKPLPQHNYIDQHIDAKLQKLRIQPSAG